MKSRLVIAILFLASSAWAYTPDTCILGPGDGNPDQPPVGSDNLSTNGQDRANTWKAFRWEANGTGDAYVFSIRMQSVGAMSTSVNLAYAIYDDNAGVLGALKVWGYTNGYDFTTIGVGRHYFDIGTSVTGRGIVAGTIYWIAFRSTLGLFAEDGSTSYFERAGGTSEPYADWMEKCISSTTADPDDMSETPLSVASYTCGGGIADNYYGWAIWTKAGAATPSVSNVTGAVLHGQSITITGAAFGTKSPAAPLIWDNGEASTVDSDAAVTTKGWSDVWPVVTTADVAAYRTRYRTIPYRSTSAPHSHSTKYLAGGHYQYAGNSPQYIGDPTDDQQYRNVSVTIDSGAADRSIWFATWYYRVDPLWPIDTATTCAWNHKTDVVQTSATSYSPVGENAYMAFCSSNSPETGGATMKLENEHFFPDGCDTICSDAQTIAFANPRSQWIKYEHQWQNDATHGMRTIYVDNVKVTELSGTCNNGLPNTRSFTVGGYFRYVDEALEVGCDCDDWGNTCTTTSYSGSQNAFRYFDDIYIDTTWSRVMLCNNATYASATICEPQIPSVWDAGGGSITATVNLGALPTSGKAYLFVFDSANAANGTGYEVDINPPTATGVTATGVKFQ